MSSFTWEELSGTVLPDGFALKKVIQETPFFALFHAHSVSGTMQPEALVEVVSPQEDPQTVVNRFLEATYLKHPNVAGISSAGVLEDRGLVYAVAEPVDHTLTHYVAQRPLPTDDALELVEQLVAALSYIHSENLVFCNLRPESVWRTASAWKLGDFSQLRVIGSGSSRDLRAALARRPDLPPEVYEGVVSPAWDIWSLGVLLRRILGPQPATITGAVPASRGRHLRNAELPAPFDTITRDCLDPNPNARITLEEILARLQAASSAKAAETLRTGRDPSGNRIFTFVRKLPEQSSRVKALVALVAAVLFLIVLVAANALLRRGSPEAPILAQAPPVSAVSEADRRAEPPVRAPARETLPATTSTRLPDDVKRLLDKWVSSTRARDVRSNVDCYAPVVDSYYGRQQLSRSDLLREKQRQFQTIGTVHRYGVDNVQFNQLSPQQAIVIFDKQWSFGDRNPFSGSERGQLTLRNVNGNWKIAGEREVKVYWVRHGRQS